MSTQNASAQTKEVFNKNLFLQELDSFTGTTQYHRASIFSSLVVTDGIQYLRDKLNCYWLIDAVSSHQPKLKERGAAFQVWKIKVNLDNSCVVTCREDSDQPEIVRQEIGYTDFPLEEFEFWCIDGVVLLKSEY